LVRGTDPAAGERMDEVNQGYRDVLAGRNIRGLLVHDH
jgi:hypothetical protein